MAHESPGRCPVCNEGLQIARLQCPGCGTAIEGLFEQCRFCRLGREQRQFAEVFIKCRGNIREVERDLGISYPTVRNRLEQLLIAMGFSAPEGAESPKGARPAVASKGVLEKLDRGEISVEEAIESLRAPQR